MLGKAIVVKWVVGFAYNHQPRHETEDMVKVFQPVVGFSSVEQQRERKKE